MKKIPLGKWNKRLLAVTALFAVTGVCAQSTATYAHYVVSTRLPVEPIVVQTPAELTATMGGLSAPSGTEISLSNPENTYELLFSLPDHGETTFIQLTLDDKTAYGQLDPGQTMTLYIRGTSLKWDTVDAIPEDGPLLVDGMTLPIQETQPTEESTEESIEQPIEESTEESIKQPTPESSAEPTPTQEPTATPTVTSTPQSTETTSTPMATPTPQPTETTATPTPAASEKPEGTQQPEQKTPET